MEINPNSSGFLELGLKFSYDSDDDNVLDTFYNPVLAKSVKYCRLAGFFTSSALAVAARGISGLLKNDGEMKLVAGAVMKKEDVDAIAIGATGKGLIAEVFLGSTSEKVVREARCPVIVVK